MIYLIRHGDTELSKKYVFCGRLDPALTKDAKSKYLKLRRKLRNLRIDRIYCSPARRCLEFAHLIFPYRDISVIDELREMDFGEWEGLNYIAVLNLGYKFEKNPLKINPPSGESFRDFYGRVKSFWHKIKKQDNIAIISHGGVLRLLLIFYQDLSLDYFWKINICTGQLLKLSLSSA